MQQQSKINPKSYSVLFLIILLVHICVDVFVSILSNRYEVPLWLQLVLSEASILIPGLIWMLHYNASFVKELGFRKIKISTALMSILLAYLLMPLVSLVNLISQLFTRNEVMGISSEMINENSLLMIFIIGFFGPFCEELIFRGIISKGMTAFGSVIASALVSGLFFGLMHMNLNQFCYAFVLGVIFSIVNYASGSIFTSLIMHIVVNAHNVILLIGMAKLYGIMGINITEMDFADAADTLIGSGFLYYAIAAFLVLAFVFTAVSLPVFGFIAKNENNTYAYSKLMERPESESEITPIQSGHSWWLNFFSIVATVLCVVIIFFLDKILMIFGY